jgi:hypothetical protein
MAERQKEGAGEAHPDSNRRANECSKTLSSCSVLTLEGILIFSIIRGEYAWVRS